jgi:hypothetical protein
MYFLEPDMYFPMIELKDNLKEAQGWLETAMEGLYPEGLDDEEIKEYFAACPQMIDVDRKLLVIRNQLVDLWTPEMKAQLAREEEEYQDLADRHDAQPY